MTVARLLPGVVQRAGARGAGGRARSRLGLGHLMSEPSDPHERAARWRNWTGDQSCSPRRSSIPARCAELAHAIVRAGEAGSRVRVVGAGHSFSDIACSDGTLLALDRLAGVLDVDATSGLVRVQAGITIRELSRRLDAHGLAMENLGDIDVQSIAGAISTATHGTGARLREHLLRRWSS